MRKRLSKNQRAMVYKMYDGHCAYCGNKISYEEMQIDHIQPLALGGKDELSNMFPACRSCNKYKSTYTVEKFRKALERIPLVLKRNSSSYRIAERFGLIRKNKVHI